MLRLAKFIKPYLIMVLLTIALLFVQANADLALPDYMSRIVNYGIQQGGVQSAVPQAIRQSQMDRVTLFLSDADKARVLGDYTLVDQKSPDYGTYLKDYPGLAGAPVYVLKDVGTSERDWMNLVMAKALMAVSGIEQIIADPTKASAAGGFSGFDLSRLPKGTDVFALLRGLPAAQRAQISAQMDKQFSKLGDSMIVQSGIRVVKAEYEALGMDTARMQNNYILQTGAVMLLISLVSVVCAILVSYLSARTAAGVSRDMRKAVFQKVEGFSNSEFDKFSTASLITRSTNDVTQIQMVVIMMMRMVFYAPIMGVGGIIRAVSKDTGMWWIIAVGVGMLLSLVVIVFSLSLPKFKRMQIQIDRLNLVMRENLSGMMVIRAFNMQPFEEGRFDFSQ